MNARENFERMMTGRDPAWVPMDLPVTGPVSEMIRARRGTGDAAEAFDLDFHGTWGLVGDDPRAWRAALEGLGYAFPPDASIGYCGTCHRSPPRETLGVATHLTEMLHPLEVVTDARQLERLPWRLPQAGDVDRLRVFVTAAHAKGRAAVVSLECTVFEHAWYVRGMDNLFCDLAEGNGIGEWLLDWFTRRSELAAGMAAAAGADVIGLGDDVGTQRGMMMSVDTWREQLRPRLGRVIDAIRANTPPGRRVWIRYHSDGDIRAIVPDLIALGVDLLNPVQPECMPVEQTIGEYRDRVAFWGMIGTQTTMPFGSTTDVTAAVTACVRQARDGARLVIAPTHVLEPDVPWANIETLVAAVKENRLDAAAAR